MPLSRSEVMSRIRGKNTGPELAVRKALCGLGFNGYRLHYGACRIDIAFVRRKIAVFVDGCFWHGCPGHFRMPKTNVDFWRRKIERNRERDKEVNKVLKREGWVVVRLWEHQIGDGLDDVLTSAFGGLMKKKRRSLGI